MSFIPFIFISTKRMSVSPFVRTFYNDVMKLKSFFFHILIERIKNKIDCADL